MFRENDPADAFYIILSGSVEVFEQKLNKSLAVLKDGEFFGELSLMLGVSRSATIKALEETDLFTINKKNFQQLLQDYPRLAEVIARELSEHREELAERQQKLKELGLWEEEEKNFLVKIREHLVKIFEL